MGLLMGQPHEMVDIMFFLIIKRVLLLLKVHQNDFNFQNFRGSIHFQIDSPMLCYHGFYINKNLVKGNCSNMKQIILSNCIANNIWTVFLY